MVKWYDAGVMMGWQGKAVVACAVVAAWACAGCGGRPGQEGDADAEGDGDDVADLGGDGEDVPADVVREAEIEWPDAAGVEAEEATVPPVEAQCGDGHIDLEAGEECDDRNRLNGDGCDWQCRAGDGEPGPGLDPDVHEYEPDGETVVLVGDGDASSPGDLWAGSRIPLVWTGSEYATAWVRSEYRDPPLDTLWLGLRFLRFDREGVPMDPGWTYPASVRTTGVEMVWLGDGFALFFDLQGTGIVLLFLDPDGKPRGDPILVIPDPGAKAPAVDLAEGGFVVAWVSSPGTWFVGCEDPATGCAIVVQRLSMDGSTAGMAGPVILEDTPYGIPDVATGEDGFGITMGVGPYTSSSFRFVKASQDLGAFTYSGILGEGNPGDLVTADGGWSTAWILHGSSTGMYHNLCAAHFAGSGDLAYPPVCSDAWGTPTASGVSPQVRVAADDVGLGIAWLPPTDFPGLYALLLRTDFLGNQTLDPIYGPRDMWAYDGSLAIARAADAFGIVVVMSEAAWFRRFVPR